MARLHLNAAANLAGQAAPAAVSVVLIPLYVRWLGPEAYGLVGFFATAQAAFQLFDLGLSVTMNRELARYSASPAQAAKACDFVRTLELTYWAIGVLLGIALALAAPLISRHWLGQSSLPVPVVEQALAIMGLVTALQWPLSLYEGGLLGLQRQVDLAAIKIGVALLGGAGAVATLLWISPTVTAFFVWQALVAAVQVALLAWMVKNGLPRIDRPPAFSSQLLRASWRFAAGMSGISITAIVLLQADKVVLSRLLPLEQFGYYSVAAVVSGAIPMLVAGPVFNAVFPRLTALVASGQAAPAEDVYRGASQVVVVVAVPLVAALALFAGEVLEAWTRVPALATFGAPVLGWLVVGSGLNALMTLPCALQLAHGWTGVGLRLNLALVALQVPALLLAAPRYGAVGAAATWAAVNGAYLLAGLPLTHRRLLPSQGWRSMFRELVAPALAGATLVGAVRLFAHPEGTLTTVATVALAVIAGLAAAMLSAPFTRGWAVALVEGRPGRAGQGAP
jgi:O-antigen/teichoic acid export membrane protein